MTHTYSAGGSRRTAVFAAIVGLHFGIFLVVAAGVLPPITVIPEPAAPEVTLLPPTPEPQVPVRPDNPHPIEYAGERVEEPRIQLPLVDEQTTSAAVIDQNRAGDVIAARPAIVEVTAPRLRMQGDRLAALINACYPPGSRRAGEEGRAVVRLLVGSDGKVRSWRLQQGTGFPRLDEAVRCIIERLVIEPGRRDGRAVEAEAFLPIVFRLD
jgi:protein TonB